MRGTIDGAKLVHKPLKKGEPYSLTVVTIAVRNMDAGDWEMLRQLAGKEVDVVLTGRQGTIDFAGKGNGANDDQPAAH